MIVQKMKTAEDIANNQFEYLASSQAYLSKYGKKGKFPEINLGQGCAGSILLMMNYPAKINGDNVVLDGHEIGYDKVFMISLDSILDSGCPEEIVDNLKDGNWPDSGWTRPDVEPEPVAEPEPEPEPELVIESDPVIEPETESEPVVAEEEPVSEPVSEETVEETSAEEKQSEEDNQEPSSETEDIITEEDTNTKVENRPLEIRKIEQTENVVYAVANLDIPSEDESVAETELRKNYLTMWGSQYSFNVKAKDDGIGATMREVTITLFPLTIERPPYPVRFIACLECNGTRKIVFSPENSDNKSVEVLIGDYAFVITAQFFRSGKFRGVINLDADSPYEMVEGSYESVFEMSGSYIPKSFGKVLGNEEIGLVNVFPLEEDNDIDGNGCAACIYLMKSADGTFDTGYTDGETLRLYFKDKTRIYMCYWSEEGDSKYFNVEEQEI